MGRYYRGDIEGKFMLGIQNSNDADFFGIKGQVEELVYISGENLLTVAPDYIGFDPDGNSDGTGVSRADFANYPLSRVIRIGCKLNF